MVSTSTSSHLPVHLLFPDPYQSFNIVLSKICEKDITEERLLNYLNAFVKLTLRIEGKFDKVGVEIEDILSWY